MATPNDIVAKARTQIGVKESPKGTNNVKYNTAYYGQEVHDGLWGTTFAWCCAFIWWVFRECGASQLFYGGKKTASCTTLMEYYKQKGQFSKTPTVGSLVFYNWGSGSAAKHIGIVTKINADGSIKAVEGNTAVGNDSNGGEVMERTRYANQILGYADPYPKTPATAPTLKGGVKVVVKLDTLRKGSKGDAVKALQILLNGHGFDCGEADGDFGAQTEKALKAFQKSKKLTQDAIAGAKTWGALLGV